MTKFLTYPVITTVAFFCASNCMAEAITKDKYQFLEKNIESEYESAKKRCEKLQANAGDICLAELKGQKSVSKAELKLKYEPTLENEVDARIAKAEAEYSVAKEKCDDVKEKSSCNELAVSAKDKAIADARAMKKL
ncbi:MAG: hypothetical protein V4575_01100 [Pseudomonadota bacterium]